MSKTRYLRGSEWRRWDLHVHTPESALSSHFGSWDKYVDALEKKGADIAVIGITDYCSIEGYKRVKQFREAGRLSSFALVIPNIEFRVSPETPDGKGINIHVLIAPDDPDHIEKIEQALRKLKFTWNTNPYACVRDELIALGKAHKPSQLDPAAAFKNGVNAFKPPFEALRDWRDENGWLRTNSLIVVANSKDGASGLSKDAGFSATRDELYRFSDMVFSGNPSDRAYFLGKGSDAVEKLLEEKGSLKPCIHGSDAHDDAKLFAPDLDRFCWVKADPTFEGLRQLIHEPEERVYIGPTVPSSADKSKIIDSVQITGGAAWFTNVNVPLNPGLIAVIGEKGSGKTALAEMIAFACGAWASQGSNSSFIWKARNLVDGIKVTVKWADGHTSTARLDRDAPQEFAEVRYLSQDFVEQLCSQDFKGEKLVAEVESVVFAHIDETERLDASSFQELRRIKTTHIETKRSDIRAKLARANGEIVRIEDEIALKEKKVALVKQHEDAIAAIDKQLPALQSSADQKVAAELTKEKTALQTKNARLVDLNKKSSLVGTTKNRVHDFYTDVDEQYAEIEGTLSELGLTDAEIVRFKPVVTGKPIVILEKLERDLEKEAVALRGDPKKPNDKGNTIADIQARISKLEKLLAADEKVRGRLLELQRQRQKLDGELTRLKQEIVKIDTTLTKNLTSKRDERWKTYLTYFDLLTAERKELLKLYEPLGKVIAEDASGTKSGFDLNVRQTVDDAGWIASGTRLLDGRRREVVIGTSEFAKELEKTLVAAWCSGNGSTIKTELEKILTSLHATGPEVDKLLAGHATRTQLYDWLFSPEHVRLDYGLTYQGTDLDALSPGTRGIVLLVLYLAMDQTDRRPLIIDQPEGNLDNSSIYESLVPFLRQAKNVRQVMLVTHNPNLVVTTDAEQVVVAIAKKPIGAEHTIISYEAGSLEYAGDISATRDQAVRLLEGGKKPFKIREGRWAIASFVEKYAPATPQP